MLNIIVGAARLLTVNDRPILATGTHADLAGALPPMRCEPLED